MRMTARNGKVPAAAAVEGDKPESLPGQRLLLTIRGRAVEAVLAARIPSSEADRLPWTCGRAKSRIVSSTPCMMFGSMTDIVIMPQLAIGTNASPSLNMYL